MAARAGGARGGSGSRISPRLAQSLTSTGLPRLTVKELEENAAALRELAALQAAAKAKKAAVPALALPIAASPPRAEDAKAPTSSSDGVVGRIVLDEEGDVAALALENEQLRRLIGGGGALLACTGLPSIHRGIGGPGGPHGPDSSISGRAGGDPCGKGVLGALWVFARGAAR